MLQHSAVTAAAAALESLSLYARMYLQDERQHNEALRKRMGAGSAAQEAAIAAFNRWAEEKEAAARARRLIAFIPCMLEGEALDIATDSVREPSEDEVQLWQAVGLALFSIDHSLLGAFSPSQYLPCVLHRLVCTCAIAHLPRVPELAGDWCTWSAPLFAAERCNRAWLKFKNAAPGAHRSDASVTGGAGMLRAAPAYLVIACLSHAHVCDDACSCARVHALCRHTKNYARPPQW